MKLVVGGAYQGKLEYAKNTFGVADGWIDGQDCDISEIADCRGIYNFHLYIKRVIEWENDTISEGEPVFHYHFETSDLSFMEEQAKEFTAYLKQINPGLIIVSDELGYGIVPVDKNDRIWRELVGRMCTSLAEVSDEVVRVVCGIGVRIK